MMRKEVGFMCGIYCIENLINGKKYVGQSINIEERIKHHKAQLNSEISTHHNAHLQNAWDKYGEENFNFYILEECTEDELDDKEKYWSEFYKVYDTNSGYALKTAGRGIGSRIISEETRKKMSISSSRYKISELAHIKAIEVNSIPVVQLTLFGECVSCYSSSAEASRTTGINESTINSCCNKDGRAKSAGGFIWMHQVDYDNCNKDELYYTNNHVRPVVQLDKSGVYIAEFESSKEAQIAMHKPTSNNINQCCRGEAMSAYGYIWVFKDQYDRNKDYSYQRRPYGNQYGVIQLDKEQNVIAKFNSVQEAHKITGVNYSCICECCNGTQQTAGGFIWVKNLDDNRKLIKGGDSNE
jgi:hypothetical protein